jgi:hypothetical protein
MSRFFLALALLIALFSSASAESILQDNAGQGLTLPTTGGNATSVLTLLTATRSTSPYILAIYLNNGVGPNNPIGGEVESFYINSRTFGNATLLGQGFQPFGGSNGTCPQSDCLRNATNPNTQTGAYIFTFIIPVLGFFNGNLTYINSGTNPLPVVDSIQITVFNPMSIVGDPQFVGLRGQSYQVHGIDGAVYNIISEQNTQVNSRFVFLTEGACPTINGQKDVNCWSHPGSYLGEISFQAIVDGKLHAALVSAGSAKKGFSSVQMDGKALKVGDSVSFGSFSLTLKSSHSVAVTTENFEFELSNSDMFINQALRSKVSLSQLTSHGLLGQTHSTKTYPSMVKYIEGEVDDYVIADSDIFGTDFLFNKFNL